MEYISYLNNSLYMGFVCKNGICKSAGPDEKSECFSSSKHEPNEIYELFHNNSHHKPNEIHDNYHNNSHHKIRHNNKNHLKHRGKHHKHTTTTTTPTTSTTTTTSSTTTTPSTTTTTTTQPPPPQPTKRKNKKKFRLSRKKSSLKKEVTTSTSVTAEILSTVYSSSTSYLSESESDASSTSVSSSSSYFDVDPTSSASASSSISSIMDSSSYGATDDATYDAVSSTNIPVSPNKLSSTTEYNNNYLKTSNKKNINRKLRKHHPTQSTISALTTLDVVPTATLLTDGSPSSSTTEWDSDVSASSSSSQPSSSSYYFNHNELGDWKSSTFQDDTIFSEDPSSTSSLLYLPDPQVVPTSSTLVARKKSRFLKNLSSSSSSFSPEIDHKVGQNASTSLRKLLEIEEK